MIILLAVGQAFVIITGGIDLSVGAILACSSMIGAVVMRNMLAGGAGEATTILVGFAVALLAGAAMGLINGLVITKLKITPFIATLGMLGVATGSTNLLSGGTEVVGLPPTLGIIGNTGLFAGWVTIPVLVTIAVALIAGVVLARTRFGLRMRAVGENPKAVDTAGISVVALRYQAVIITGLLAGIAGAYFSIAQGSGFGNNMTAGKGYIALAALIFAKWKPVPAMFTCLLFGFLDALQIRLQSARLGGIEIPVQAIQALPYVLTVILLAGFIGKAIGPKAGGVPYTKER